LVQVLLSWFGDDLNFVESVHSDPLE